MFEFIQDLQLTEFEITALWLSLKVSGIASLSILPIAILIAYLLSRSNFFGKSLLEAIVYLPLVLPPVVIGYLLLIGLSGQSVVGAFLDEYFNLKFAFHWQGAALAVAVVALPLMVRSIRLAFDLIDVKIEQAALTLGASPLRVFMSISLPLALPGIISGAILGLARGLGEFGATITFAANIPGQTQTLPLAMYSFIQTPGAEYMAARLCVIAIMVAIFALLISEFLTRKMKQKLAGDN
jgi:molybdate transport system permease protein